MGLGITGGRGVPGMVDGGAAAAGVPGTGDGGAGGGNGCRGPDRI
jgi:hypothetical protein